MYRVSHIKLDRVKGSKLRFVGQIRKFKENARFLEYYVRILALKIGDNQI